MGELTCSSFHFAIAVGASQALTFTSSEGHNHISSFTNAMCVCRHRSGNDVLSGRHVHEGRTSRHEPAAPLQQAKILACWALKSPNIEQKRSCKVLLSHILAGFT